MNLNLESKNTPSTKSEYDLAIRLLKFFHFLITINGVTDRKQKVAMETSWSNEHCQCMQNDPQRCKIKAGKFHFIILWPLELLRKVLKGGRGRI